MHIKKCKSGCCEVVTQTPPNSPSASVISHVNTEPKMLETRTIDI
jgi:hypothetical protein